MRESNHPLIGPATHRQDRRGIRIRTIPCFERVAKRGPRRDAGVVPDVENVFHRVHLRTAGAFNLIPSTVCLCKSENRREAWRQSPSFEFFDRAYDFFCPHLRKSIWALGFPSSVAGRCTSPRVGQSSCGTFFPEIGQPAHALVCAIIFSLRARL